MHRLENLTANSLKYQPAVNQVELNFWNPQPELLKVCTAACGPYAHPRVLLYLYSAMFTNRVYAI